MVKKVKWTVTGADLDEADTNDDFEPYDGPTPPKGVYAARIKTVKVTESSAGNSMLKVLLIIDGKASGAEKKKYDGAPIWDNVVDTPQTAFQVARFLKGVAGTKSDWARTTVDDEGNILKMGRLKLQNMLVRISTKTEMYEGDAQVRVDRYLPPKDEEVDDVEDDDVDDVDDVDEEDGEDYEDDDDADDYEEEEPPPPPRKTAKKAAPVKKAAARTPAKKAPARRQRNDDDEPPF